MQVNLITKDDYLIVNLTFKEYDYDYDYDASSFLK